MAATRHNQTPAGHPSVENQSFDFVFLTGNKQLDQKFINYELTCSSDRSLSDNAVAVHVFRVDFIDECYDTIITPAFNDDVTIPLFDFFYESMLAYSTQNLACNPIYYTMFVTDSTSTDPADIFWNLDYNDYELNPTNFDNRGEYTVVLRSCVPVGSTKVCVFSPSWTITVYDPCLDTYIVSSGWSKVLTAPQLGQSSLNFATQIALEGGNFPWTTQLDIVTPDSVGVDLCGPIVYQIQALSYEESLIQPLITQSEQTITLQPSQEFSTGTYQLALVGTLVQYPEISATRVFTVEVSGCNTVISGAQLSGPVIATNGWFLSDTGTSFMAAVDDIV